MKITLDIAAALSAILWPVVILSIVFAFRKIWPTLAERLASRVTKLSAFDISVELATIPAPPSPWSDPSIPQNSEMLGGDVYDTALMTLFERIGETTSWDYLIVDIKDGNFWFVSRLFIFTVFLQALRGVKCVIFVESNKDAYRKLIGLASPEAVRSVLGNTYPWLETALSNAMLKLKITYLAPTLKADVAGRIIREFIEDPDMRRMVTPDNSDEWTQLGTLSVWEHTVWLNRENLYKILGKQLYEWDSAHYVDTSDIPAEKRAKELLNRRAPFIALINSKGEFKELLDRQKLLEQVVQSLQRD